jgi:NADPH-dependent glutamate synthase beta subunit-like oxidoreductase
MLRLIPADRLDQRVVQADIDFILSLGAISCRFDSPIPDPAALLGQGYDAVCVSTGLWQPIALGIENESLAVKMVDLLGHPERHRFEGRVAIIGGGATAVDCALVAQERGARHVELFMLEKLSEMPLTKLEQQELIDHDIEVNCRTRITRITEKGSGIGSLETRKVTLPDGQAFRPASVLDVPGTETQN